jgi:hypothetical protein
MIPYSMPMYALPGRFWSARQPPLCWILRVAVLEVRTVKGSFPSLISDGFEKSG